METMIRRKTIETIPGEVGVTDSDLVYARIHWISRSDLHYIVKPESRSVPQDLEVFYGDSTGSLRFLNQFNSGEKINVVYEV